MHTFKQIIYGRTFAILLNLLLVGVAVWFITTPNPTAHLVLKRINYMIYDLRLRLFPSRAILKNSPVVIVDIDEKSLAKEGRWPWPRDKVATLVASLQQQGVVVIAFDILFSEPQLNAAKHVIAQLPMHIQQQEQLKENFNKLQSQFAYDEILAKQLTQGETVLGMIFDNEIRQSVGILPSPILSLTPEKIHELDIIGMPSYTATIPRLLEAGKHGGFLTTIPDEDGIIRRSPLLLQHDHKIYPSLALEAVRLYLLINQVSLNLQRFGDRDVVEGVYLGKSFIPTDAHAQVLIPFAGKRGSITTLSATDIMTGNPFKSLKNSLVIIGTSALGLGDLKATPIQSVFPGVEIQGNIAAGLLNQHFAFAPAWAKGVEMTLVVGIGLFLSLTMPFLSALLLMALTGVILFLLVTINLYYWVAIGLALPMALSFFLILALAIFNSTYGYLTEYRDRKELKSIFDQYVPPAHIDEMMKSHDTSFMGETRTMTVLFSDIRGFTHISETLEASELKSLLNRFFTEITDVIFKYEGTIDKYVGDMVMAFWGAPLTDKEHAMHAIKAALDMQETVTRLHAEFQALGYPEINIGIGINTGEMSVGDMGSKFRRNYTVLGDAVNLGSRLESLTKTYGVKIIVSETSRENQPDFVFRQLDRVRVKGKDQPVTIYEPISLDMRATIDDELKQYTDALADYYRQDWKKAKKLFRQLHSQYPSTKVYEIYLARIEEYEKSPPPQEWDGVYTHTQK